MKHGKKRRMFVAADRCHPGRRESADSGAVSMAKVDGVVYGCEVGSTCARVDALN